MKKKIFAVLYYVNLLFALFLIFFSIYFFSFSDRLVFIQESYVIFEFNKFNLSESVDQKHTFYGNVTGQYLFYQTANYTGPFYEFTDSNGFTLKLVPKFNESFELGTPYIILARIVQDSGVCVNNESYCPDEYFLDALMRNR